MHIFNNLNNAVKKVFLFRFIYLITSITLSVYCISILSLVSLKAFIPIILGCNIIFILNSIAHIWILIYYNSFSDATDCVPITMEAFHIIPFMTTIIYFGGQYYKQYIVHEFAIILIYAIIYYTILAIIIILGLIFLIQQCCMCCLETKKIIDERNHLNKYEEV